MRLIDADALPIKFDGHTVSVWKNDIDNAPTVDAVEVVRCKDCIYCVPLKPLGLSWLKDWYGSCRYFNTHSVDADGYCSYGERREEG